MCERAPAAGRLAFPFGWETVYSCLVLSPAPSALTARKQVAELFLILRVQHPNCWFSLFSF